MEIRTAEELLGEKGGHMYAVSPATTILDALKLMVDKKIGAILVQDGQDYVGIWTERDLMRNTVVEGFDPAEVRVADQMTRDLVAVAHDTPVYSMADKILGLRMRHLLVEREGAFIGLLSAGDILREGLRSRTQELRELDEIVHLDYYEAWKWRKKRKS